jgi:uncharacterized protein VirK/YbjX
MVGSEMPFASAQKLRVTGETWSPSRIARVAFRVLGHLPYQLEILRLLKYPVLAELLPSNPRFAIKFAADDYLARDLSVAERKSCFLHHYGRLLGALPDRMLRRILHRSVSIFEFREGDSFYRVIASLSRPWDKEGELSLTLELNGTGIYVIAFSIVPGSIVHSEAPEVLLISRMQGMKGKYGLIQRATKAMSDVAPASFLLAALQGFAEAFGVGEIVGVSAVRQSAYSEESDEIFRKAYDEFFNTVGAVLGPDNLFRCPVPIPEKRLQDVKRGHKLRTKEKQAFKRDVSDTVLRFFQRNWRTGGQPSQEEQTSDVPVELMQ